jgi:hypothetical protein
MQFSEIIGRMSRLKRSSAAWLPAVMLALASKLKEAK